jgi:hypothetical protein
MTDGSRMLRFSLQKFPATGDAQHAIIEAADLWTPDLSQLGTYSPTSNAAGDLKDACGLPFACVAQPFARSRLAPLDAPCELKAKEIARCTDCYA